MGGKRCIQHECIDWVQERYCPDPAHPEVVELRWDCLRHHHYRVARDAARFADQAGAAINDLRNEAVQAHDELMGRMDEPVMLPAHSQKVIANG